MPLTTHTVSSTAAATDAYCTSGTSPTTPSDPPRPRRQIAKPTCAPSPPPHHCPRLRTAPSTSTAAIDGATYRRQEVR